jgi:hypothetical protein
MSSLLVILGVVAFALYVISDWAGRKAIRSRSPEWWFKLENITLFTAAALTIVLLICCITELVRGVLYVR